MKRFSLKTTIASLLTLAVIMTSLFPGGAYAGEVSEQVDETAEAAKEALDEKTATDNADTKTEDKSGESVISEPETNKPVEESVKTPTSLLLLSDTIPEDVFGATSQEMMAGVVKLTYDSKEVADQAYHVYVEQGYRVEYDTAVDVIEDESEKTEEVDKNEVNLEEVEVVEEQLEEVVEIDNKKKVTVAIIDTGLDLNHAVLKDRLADGYNPTITDENGHGTLMAEIIASQTSENVKILPLKAFDENGKSTVGQVYDAIMSACESGVDVINLSVSGAGTSKMLTHAIDTAKAKGIVVVVASGNNASDVAGYMPGNIENAITISATDENKAFAEYSNYGDRIDYAAMGTIIKDHGTEDTSDDEIFQGTSIASAYVSGYAAYILDHNENADVEKCLEESADDFGGTASRTYFGNGFLSFENIVYNLDDDGSEKGNEKEDNQANEEEIVEEAEDKTAELNIAYNEYETFVANLLSNPGDTNISLDRDISLPNINLGPGKKVINGNGHNFNMNVQGSNLIVPAGTQLYVSHTVFDCGYHSQPPAGLVDCVIDGYGGYVNIANCEFKNMYYDESVAVRSSNGSRVDISYSTVHEVKGRGFICDIDRAESSPYAQMYINNCVAYDINGLAMGSHCRYVNIQNCTVYNCNQGISVGGIYNDSSTSYAANCIVYNCKDIGMIMRCNSTIENCSIQSNGTGIACANDYGTEKKHQIKNVRIAATNTGILVNNGVSCYVTGTSIQGYDDGIYLSNNADLQSAFGGNSFALRQHMAVYGFAEGRNAGNYRNQTFVGTGIVNQGYVEIGTGSFLHYSKNALNNTGTAKMTSGNISSNQMGVINSGTFTMTAGAIKDSTKMNVDISDGTVNFKGGSITGSGAGYYGVRIENSGSATFNQFSNIGINNAGSVRNQAVGINRYNVYNGATSALGSNGLDTGVFLDSGASMTIHQPLTKDVKVASYDRYTGKVIANCDSEAIAKSAQEHLKLTSNASYTKTTLNTRKYADTYGDLKNAFGYNYEALWNHYNTYGRTEKRANDDANKTVVYRQGNGNTGAKTQIIVSQVEKTSFDSNLAANGLTNAQFRAKIRTSDEFTGHKNAAWRDYVDTYWGENNSPRAESIVYLDGEDVSKSIYNTGWATTSAGPKVHSRILKTYAAWYPTTLYAKYETGYDPNANHNDIDKPDADDGTDDIIDPNPQAPEQVDGDTPNPQGFSYFFDGNGQDKGANYTVRHVSSAYRMPGNAPFEKQIHSGQGWSIVNNATYQFADEPTKCRKEGETVNTLVLLNACIDRKDCVLMVSDGNITITQFVVWDKFPEITSKDVAIAQAWLDTMTEEEIKSKIYTSVIGTDAEDGRLPNNKEGRIGVTVIDFDMDELRAFHGTGNVTVTFRATDGVGNTADTRVRLWVNSKYPIENAYPNRARCINRKYYDAGKGYAEGDLTGYKKGGLMPNDLWYTNPKYATIIEEAFDNLENETWDYTWYFTHEQVLETQDWIEEHGFGDSEEEGALKEYFNKYKAGFMDYTK